LACSHSLLRFLCAYFAFFANSDFGYEKNQETVKKAIAKFDENVAFNDEFEATLDLRTEWHGAAEAEKEELPCIDGCR